jgi:hypothetical protein
MKERPIIFSAPMVRSILGGHKTQTRRIVKLPLDEDWKLLGSTIDESGWATFGDETYPATMGRAHVKSPYGIPGDRLWVRESIWRCNDTGNLEWYVADAPNGAQFNKTVAKKPAIHMPRSASRITLEITDLRVERLQNISEADALAEGIDLALRGLGNNGAIPWYCALWESINGKGSWTADPWVWVITFKRVFQIMEKAS